MYDFIDYKFGELKVIGYSNENVCICKCSCKKLILVPEKKLLRGDIKNCGHKFILKTDRTRLINIYNGMRARCYNIKSSSYKYYGKRGIKICKRWLDKEKGFERFYKWSINNGYKDGLTIDRINNKKNYTPQNCRWVDMITQNNNRKICKYIIYNEKKQTISEWAREFGISRYKLIKEIKEKGEQKAIERFLYNVK